MDFKVINWTTWMDIEPYFNNLLERNIGSETEFKNWLQDNSELEKELSENMAWRYIKMTCDTKNNNLEKDYLYFVNEVQPHVSLYADKINNKLIGLQQTYQLDEHAFKIYYRNINNEVLLFREENIPLQAELNTLSQQYGSISGAMTILDNGKEITLQQATKHLKSQDRNIRKEFFEKINARRFEDKKKLNDLLDNLIILRNKVAKNAGFENYRDYKHKELCRFDYTVADCFAFHDAIAQEVVPLNKKIMEHRKKILNYDSLKPYDTEVDLSNQEALHPFENGEDLINKTIIAFDKLDPFFGDVIRTMKDKKHLDVESRIGKAPGGYNYPLAKSVYPFIFMNAAGQQSDLETMVHEGGHAIHSVLNKDLWLTAYSNCPSEVAELASMSMELISMDVWDEFYKNENDLKRAKKEQLEGVIKTLPWIANIDRFQHYLYLNPEDSHEERAKNWLEISSLFSSDIIDWTGYEKYKENSWQKQLHIYEVPFYYIEYGFAQLGALGVWKSYKDNKSKGIENYKAALSLGNTRSIGEIYQTAGAKFDFSPAYIKELFEFLWKEYEALD